MNGNWIKIYRSFLNWEWFTTPNMAMFFVYCLSKANYKDKKWQGQTIKRGSFITSRDTLAKELNLSVQQVRTCIDRLKSTSEITSKTTNRFTLLTIVKYEDYQDYNEEATSKSTSKVTIKQPTDNQQITITKEGKEYKERKEDYVGRLENFKKQLSGDEHELWRERIYRKSQIPKNTLGRLTDKFIDHLIITDNKHETLSDFKSHFYNWINRQETTKQKEAL